MDRLTVRLDPDVKRQLDLLAAKEGTSPAALARGIIERGVMEGAQRAWAPLVRRALRDELDAFIASESMAREFSADALYGKLANELRAELDDLRVLSGAALAAALEGCGQSMGRSDGAALHAALRDGLWIGFEGIGGFFEPDGDDDEDAGLF